MAGIPPSSRGTQQASVPPPHTHGRGGGGDAEMPGFPLLLHILPLPPPPLHPPEQCSQLSGKALRGIEMHMGERMANLVCIYDICRNITVPL